MFRGPIIWRGLVYACLMTLGKLVCGLWLVRFNTTYVSGRRRNDDKKNDMAGQGPESEPSPPGSAAKPKSKLARLPKPKSLYPAAILGSAMVARGEIGFLVSAIAQSNGIFDSMNLSPNAGGTGQDLFLIVTWAIMLCTVIGPITVGLIVRRVRTLQRLRQESTERAGQVYPLGIWGLDPNAESSP